MMQHQMSKLVSEREEGIRQCKLHANHIPAAKPPSADADVLLMPNKPPDMFRSSANMAPPAKRSQLRCVIRCSHAKVAQDKSSVETKHQPG